MIKYAMISEADKRVRKAKRFLSQHKNEITRCESVMESSLNTTGLNMLRQAKLARSLLKRWDTTSA